MTTPNTPANGGQILTDALLSKAGRALADRSADSCNVNREDNWKTYGNEFIEDARAAFSAIEADLRAALAAPAIPTVDRNAVLEVADEGAQILRDLIDSIEKHGNYSAESTAGFLWQAKQCFDEIRATPATDKPAHAPNCICDTCRKDRRPNPAHGAPKPPGHNPVA